MAVAEEEKALAILYRLFSEMLDQPSDPMVERLTDGTFLTAMETVFAPFDEGGSSQALTSIGRFQNHLRERSLQESRRLIEGDYNRLFVGPAKLLAPPYESVYLGMRDATPHTRSACDPSRAIDGRHALSLKELYRKEGFSLVDAYNDSADSLRAEIDFLGHLHELASEACLSCADDLVSERLSRCETFAKKHLANWVKQIEADVSRHARLDFYPALFTFIRLAVLSECEPDVVM